MSLRRTKSTIISRAGSVIVFPLSLFLFSLSLLSLVLVACTVGLVFMYISFLLYFPVYVCNTLHQE